MTTPLTQRPILIIDGMNAFLRYVLANTATSTSGEFVGGVVGVVKFIEDMTSQFMPSKVFFVWEKGGGSARRKKLYPEYKANRTTHCANEVKNLKATMKKAVEVDTEKESSSDSSNTLFLRQMIDEKDKIRQLLLLTSVIKHLPVCQVYQADSEGDDVIAYLVKNKLAAEPAKKIVVSSDNDFYQLITPDDNVLVYDARFKKLINNESVKQKYGVSGRNFCMARIAAGDDSDNISGIPGIGMKTMAKRFPCLLSDEEDVTVEQILSEAKTASELKKPPKCFQGLLEGEDILRRNWELMYLGTNCLSASQITKIDYIVENFEPKFNKIAFMRELIAAGISVPPTFDMFVYNMHALMGV